MEGDERHETQTRTPPRRIASSSSMGKGAARMSPEERFARIEATLDTLSTVTLQQAERMSELELAMEKLASSQRQLLTAQVIMTEKVGDLADAQKRTDERINILIDVVMKQQPPAA